MSKSTHGATKAAPSKKKAKRRPEPRPLGQVTSAVVSGEAVQADEEVNGGILPAPVLQFRPRPRETVQARAVSGRAPAGKASALPATDYSYVYTDLRIIGVLVGALLVVLIALSFIIR